MLQTNVQGSFSLFGGGPQERDSRRALQTLLKRLESVTSGNHVGKLGFCFPKHEDDALGSAPVGPS